MKRVHFIFLHPSTIHNVLKVEHFDDCLTEFHSSLGATGCTVNESTHLPLGTQGSALRPVPTPGASDSCIRPDCAQHLPQTAHSCHATPPGSAYTDGPGQPWNQRGPESGCRRGWVSPGPWKNNRIVKSLSCEMAWYWVSCIWIWSQIIEVSLFMWRNWQIQQHHAKYQKTEKFIPEIHTEISMYPPFFTPLNQQSMLCLISHFPVSWINKVIAIAFTYLLSTWPSLFLPVSSSKCQVHENTSSSLVLPQLQSSYMTDLAPSVKPEHQSLQSLKCDLMTGPGISERWGCATVLSVWCGYSVGSASWCQASVECQPKT